jgi:glycosyltransferase involved in cell wall biosynthesis
VRILLAANAVRARGVGTFAHGLAAALPAALDASDRLITEVTAQARLVRPLYEQLILAVRARKVDLVHLCDYRALLLSPRPFVVTVHDVFFLDYPQWYPRALLAYKRAMLRATIAKRPRAIVCVSAYTRDRLLHHAPQLEPSVHVIHPGLLPVQAPSSPASPGAYFLTVSALEARKNHAGLLSAFERARRAGLELTWKVVGAPADRSAEIVRPLGKAEGVELLGDVPETELERLYAGARFFALASHAEGFGFPPLEAMARGVPVVCSTGSAFDETVGDAAMRVPAADVEGWTEALLRLASDEQERSRLIEAGRARAAAFSTEGTARAYVGCYRSALGR